MKSSLVLGPGILTVEPQEGGFAAPEIVLAGESFCACVEELLTGGAAGRVSEAIKAPGQWMLVLVKVS